MLKIISFDGGGSRGIFHLYFLRELEKLMGCTVREKFDYIGGTSIGGITALMVSHSIKAGLGKENCCVADLIEDGHDQKMLEANFGSKNWWYFFPRIGLFCPKYGDRVKHIQRYYEEELIGDIRFGEGVDPKCMIFSYSLTKSQAKVFKSWREKYQSIPASLIARATSAAPAFYPAVELNGEMLIDGGLAANDPSYLITFEARKEIGCLQEPIILISLGTAGETNTDYSSCFKGGFVQWARKFLNISMESQDRIVKYLLGHDGHCCETGHQNDYHFNEYLGSENQSFASYHFWNNVHYFRFAPLGESTLDITDMDILNTYKENARIFFSQNNRIVDKMADLLSL